MMALVFAGIVILIIWSYILFLREWLVRRFPGGRIQWWQEQIEDKLWNSSRTILTARAYQLAGWLLGVQTLLAASGIDTTPFTNELANLIPEQYRPVAIAVFMIVTGLAFSWIKKNVSDGVGQK